MANLTWTAATSGSRSDTNAGCILDVGTRQLGVDTSITFTAGIIEVEGGALYVKGNRMMTSAGVTLIGWGAVNDAMKGRGAVVAGSSHTLELVDEVTDGVTKLDSGGTGKSGNGLLGTTWIDRSSRSI